MSLINDALKQAREQADGERPPGLPPPAPAPVQAEPRHGGSRTELVVIATVFLGAVLLVAVAGLIVFVAMGRPRTGGVEQALNDATVPPRPIPTAPAVPEPVPAKTAAPATSTAAPAPTTSYGKARRTAQEVIEKVAAANADGQAEAATIGGRAPLPATASVTPSPPPPPVPASPPVKPKPAAPPPAAKTSAVAAVPGATPKGKFVLSGIMGVPPDYIALVNSRLVKPGDKLDGATVRRIESDHVVLSVGEGQEIELRFVNPP